MPAHQRSSSGELFPSVQDAAGAGPAHPLHHDQVFLSRKFRFISVLAGKGGCHTSGRFWGLGGVGKWRSKMQALGSCVSWACLEARAL